MTGSCAFAHPPSTAVRVLIAADSHTPYRLFLRHSVPARDKVPRRTDFPLRRAPPYFLSTGRENVREPHSPWLFFAQMVKRHACGFFFVLFLSAKKKNRTLSLSQREENPLLFLSKAAPFLPSQTKKHKKRYFFHNRLLTFYPFHANIMT